MEVGEKGWIEGKVVYDNKASHLYWLERKAEVLPNKDKNHPFRLTRQEYTYEIISYGIANDKGCLYDSWIHSHALDDVPPYSDYFPLRVIFEPKK